MLSLCGTPVVRAENIVARVGEDRWERILDRNEARFLHQMRQKKTGNRPKAFRTVYAPAIPVSRGIIDSEPIAPGQRCAELGCPFPASFKVYDQFGSQPSCRYHRDQLLYPGEIDRRNPLMFVDDHLDGMSVDALPLPQVFGLRTPFDLLAQIGKAIAIDGESPSRVSKRFSVGYQTVRAFVARSGIPVRWRAERQQAREQRLAERAEKAEQRAERDRLAVQIRAERQQAREQRLAERAERNEQILHILQTENVSRKDVAERFGICYETVVHLAKGIKVKYDSWSPFRDEVQSLFTAGVQLRPVTISRRLGIGIVTASHYCHELLNVGILERAVVPQNPTVSELIDAMALFQLKGSGLGVPPTRLIERPPTIRITAEQKYRQFGEEVLSHFSNYPGPHHPKILGILLEMSRGTVYNHIKKAMADGIVTYGVEPGTYQLAEHVR